MVKYLLIIFTGFEDQEQTIQFCSEKFNDKKFEENRYIIENDKNIFIIFESNKKRNEISRELFELLDIPEVNIYILNELSKVLSIYLPKPLKNFIYGKKVDENLITPFINEEELNLDEILEKIRIDGINSLNKSEKKFLKKFNKKGNE